MSTLTLHDVQVRFGRAVAVAGVSWQVGPGFHALLGPNGAGKTTLLRTIAGLQKPTSGSVDLDGLSPQAMRARLGFLPQENLPKTRFTVAEHLAYMCWLRQIPAQEVDAEVDRVLTTTDLADRAHDKIATLSGGMRRRVGIGSALVGQPSLVLLDEPSAGLDVAQRESLTAVLGAVARTAICIVSTHLVEDILDHADSVTVMTAGAFRLTGPFADFCPTRELDAVRDRYLAAVAP